MSVTVPSAGRTAPTGLSAARRTLITILVGVLLLVVGAYLAVGYVAADRLTLPRRNYAPDVAPRQPTLPFTKVRFPARSDGVMIAAAYIPREDATRAVVLVHGKDTNRAQEFDGRFVELAADIQRGGYAVLMVDLRGHGESDDGRFTFGLIERRDVLGALDWLVSQRFKPGSIGVLGVSMGAASGLGAAADDTGFGAVVVDSMFAEFCWVMERRWSLESRLPDLLLPSAYWMSRPVIGADLCAAKPVAEMQRIAPRPLLIIYSKADDVINTPHPKALRAAAPWADAWEATDASHAKIYNVFPVEYARRVLAHFDKMPK